MSADDGSIRSAFHWKIKYLQEVSLYFATRQASGRASLSMEIFFLAYTCLARRVSCVFDRTKGFNYVLLGLLQSNDIITLWLVKLPNSYP